MGMGSLGAAQWSTLLAVTSLTVPTVLIIWRLAPALNLLQLGEEEAHYLGVDVRTVQRVLLLCSALLVAATVAVSGVIGFIGLVIPHLMRMWLGSDHRAVIPCSVLAGAFLLLIADTLARTAVAPAEMPVGLLTSLLGAPWFYGLFFVSEDRMAEHFIAEGLHYRVAGRAVIDDVTLALEKVNWWRSSAQTVRGNPPCCAC